MADRLIDTAPRPLFIYKSLANEIGLSESIMLVLLHELIDEHGEEKNGSTWLRIPLRKLQKLLPFWSVDKVRRILLSLSKMNLITVSRLDDVPRYMTNWISLNIDAINALNCVSKSYNKTEAIQEIM